VRVRGLGIVASVSLAIYFCLAVAMLVAWLIGSRSDWMGFVFLAIIAGVFYALERIFPYKLSDEAPSPRLTAGRVVVFLLNLAALLTGYLLLLSTYWAAEREGTITIGLLACSTFLFNVLEKRWARQDSRRGVRARAWN
jgi:hypothetical protein